MNVTIYDGKYTVVQKPNGGLEVLRYGDPWRECTGDGLILALAQEIEELRAAAREACDLLAERKYGSDARSPSHNARLVLEKSLPPSPSQVRREGQP